mmetsp:Transcript_110147/g.310560  ORF Transcript_110147/g.310560 Transcript_110147/m.310560 type:complete len:263 (-) Transcript_110147:3175-3963(-)
MGPSPSSLRIACQCRGSIAPNLRPSTFPPRSRRCRRRHPTQEMAVRLPPASSARRRIGRSTIGRSVLRRHEKPCRSSSEKQSWATPSEALPLQDLWPEPDPVVPPRRRTGACEPLRRACRARLVGRRTLAPPMPTPGRSCSHLSSSGRSIAVAVAACHHARTLHQSRMTSMLEDSPRAPLGAAEPRLWTTNSWRRRLRQWAAHRWQRRERHLRPAERRRSAAPGHPRKPATQGRRRLRPPWPPRRRTLSATISKMWGVSTHH